MTKRETATRDEQRERQLKACDISYLKWVQRCFCELTRLAVCVLDHNGHPVTRFVDHVPQSARLYAIRKAEIVRVDPPESLAEVACRTVQTRISICPDTGFAAAAVPIVFEHTCAGSWAVGGILTRAPSDEWVAALAHSTGLDEEGVREELEGLRVVPPDELARLLESLRIFGDAVTPPKALPESAMDVGRSRRELAVYVNDAASGELIEANEAFASLCGLPHSRIVSRKCWEICMSDAVEFCVFCPRNERRKGRGAQAFGYYNAKFGKWLATNHYDAEWFDGRPVHVVTQLEVRDGREAETELFRLAYYDRMLGIANHLKFEMDIHDSDGQYMTHFLICFDMRSIQQLNSVHGWLAGNALLKSIARWTECFGNANVARYKIDGNIFCLRVWDMHEQEAREVAEFVERRFQKPWKLRVGGDEIVYFCSARISIMVLNEKADTSNLHNCILHALSISERKNGIAVFDREMYEAEKNKNRLALRLKNCIKGGMRGFDVHYQPIVDFASGKWKAVEALCRWNCPESGPVSPLEFIPEAERMGLIGVLGQWVLETALATCRKLRLDARPDFFLSVNVSPLQAMEPHFGDMVENALRRSGFPGEKLNLELTESSAFTFNSLTLSTVDRLKCNGISMTLDDFGTGYSSFDNLKNLPVDYVKTERNFVQGIEQDGYLQYFLYIMSELSHANGMKLIVEGVENVEQLEVTLRNGADYIQGYHFSRPLCAGDLAAQSGRFDAIESSLFRIAQIQLDFEHWLSGKASHAAAPGMFRLLQRSMQVLLTEMRPDSAFFQVLADTGHYFGVVHAVAFFKDSELPGSGVYEWCEDGQPAVGGLMTRENFDLLVSAARAKMREDGVVIFSGTERALPELGGVFRMSAACSVALIPILDEGELIGFVGLGHSAYREWGNEELVMLWNLSMLMKNFLMRERLLACVRDKRDALAGVLDAPRIGDFVAEAGRICDVSELSGPDAISDMIE